VNYDGQSTSIGSGRHCAAHLTDGDHHANRQDARNEDPSCGQPHDDHHENRDDQWIDYRGGRPLENQIVSQIVSQIAVNAHRSNVK